MNCTFSQHTRDGVCAHECLYLRVSTTYYIAKQDIEHSWVTNSQQIYCNGGFQMYNVPYGSRTQQNDLSSKPFPRTESSRGNENWQHTSVVAAPPTTLYLCVLKYQVCSFYLYARAVFYLRTSVCMYMKVVVWGRVVYVHSGYNVYSLSLAHCVSLSYYY